ncbi:MAG TPA: hypothetical protein VLJ42_08270 [Solirubrobacteraceae bacterium]|nr:hypothetical protein [Solirubrobacteraceae bacterium]
MNDLRDARPVNNPMRAGPTNHSMGARPVNDPMRAGPTNDPMRARQITAGWGAA